MFQTINPANAQKIKEYTVDSLKQVDAKLSLCHKAFVTWSRLTFTERAVPMRRLGELLEKDQGGLAQLITLEMGKPLAQAQSEVKKCASSCFYYADHAAGLLADQMLVTSAPKAYFSFQPLGVILGIMPWNYPVWQVLRFAAPTLMAGNAVIVKHAPNTWGCGEMIFDLFKEAGFPEGLYENLKIDVDRVESLIADRRVAGVSLTGSTRAGRSVAQLTGKYLKKTVLELGGSDAYVILDDADLDLAADRAVTSRMLNAGQSCVAAKRFIVTTQNAKGFFERVEALIKKYKWGNPTDPATTLGPLARRDLRDQLHDQVNRSVGEGAKLVMGGRVAGSEGFFYEPTLLDGVTADMTSFKEELFGPVASIIYAKDEREALRLANASSYGLGSAVFGRDVARAEKLAREELQAGLCFVNDYVKSDMRWSFGGVKDSGFGRELSEFGIREFVNVKSVVVA